MSSIGIITILNILLLSVALASDFICPHGQFLNESGVCVACSSCQAPKEVIIKRCHGRDDTVCGIATHLPSLKPKKDKKQQLPSKNTSFKKSATTEDEELALFESENSYNSMLHGLNNKSRKNNDAVKVKNIKNKIKKNDPLNNRDGFSDSTKFSFDKNGKHIKKDLSTADEIFRDSNHSLFEYVVKSKPNNNLGNSPSKKNKSKQKKNKDNEQSDKDDEWTRHVFPHVKNHQIYVDVKEETKPQKKTSVLALPSSKSSDELKQTLAVVLKAAEHLKNRTRLLSFGDEDLNVLKRINKNALDDDEDDDNDANNNDNDDDEEDDENEDEDDDDEDEGDIDDDENDDDEDEDDESEEDKDGGQDEDVDSSFSKKKFVPFGVDPNVLPMVVDDDADDDDSDEFVTKSNSWPVANEVNVEPFVDNSNWQLLILVSAVSACLLFFIVVNAYLCIYMKKWKHMKEDFEADVEDLSVRINLMQHAGFEADESSNMRNYLTQLKGGKSMEKMPKSCARA